MARLTLQILFATILIVMLAVTLNASLHQSLWDWGGLVTEPDRWWTIATITDAYCGFVTFYAWLFYTQRTWNGRVLWFVAIMMFGNIAMASYVLWRLARLQPGVPLERLLLRDPAPPARA